MLETIPDNKVHGANMGPIWGRQDPGEPHAGPMNFALWDTAYCIFSWLHYKTYCKGRQWQVSIFGWDGFNVLAGKHDDAIMGFCRTYWMKELLYVTLTV